MDDFSALKTHYVFRNESNIKRYVLRYPTSMAVLSGAVPELTRSFGTDVVTNLDAIIEDDDSISLYAIVVWRGSAEDAEIALEDFDERWWLTQPSRSGLTFTYELA